MGGYARVNEGRLRVKQVPVPVRLHHLLLSYSGRDRKDRECSDRDRRYFEYSDRDRWGCDYSDRDRWDRESSYRNRRDRESCYRDRDRGCEYSYRHRRYFESWGEDRRSKFLSTTLEKAASFANPVIHIGGDFGELVKNSSIFIDRSLFIEVIIKDQSKVILITMPRRCGKSMNLDMLRRFLAIRVENQEEKLSIVRYLKKG